MPEEPPYVLMKSEIKKVRLLPISRARRALGSCELTLANGDVIDYNDVFLSKERGLAKMIAKQKDDIAESRKEIQRLLKEIAGKEPEVAECCVPECVYRGFCPEFKSCGYCGSPAWQAAVEKYRRVG